MNYTITKQGCVINKDSIKENEINCIKTDLTVRPHISLNVKEERFTVYLENDTELCVPKFYAMEKFSIPRKEDLNTGNDITLNFLLELRDEQKKILKSILDAYQKNGGGILCLPCGFGKTIVALYFIALLKKKTLIIVHREFLITHWVEKIKEVFNTAKVKIIRNVDGKNVNDLSKYDIAICMLQSLATTEYPSGYFDSFGHIIIDECHRVSTTVFSSIFFKINSNYMLGLSATPERKDNMTKVIKWHIGDIIKLDIVKYKINIDVKRFVLNCEKEALLKNNECIFSNKITKLLENEIRNKIIVKTVLDELKNCPDRHFLVLSDRVDHLIILYQIFRQNKMTSVGLFIGEMDKDALKLSTGCKVILGSYSMANEGLDIPTLNCLVLASPKIEVFQTIGRISRLQENDKYIKPLIIDFIDILQVFIKEAEKRLTLYKKSNYEISDYLYNEKTNIFEKNLSKNTDYNIYLLGETVSHHKIMKKDMIDDLFGQFSHHKTI